MSPAPYRLRPWRAVMPIHSAWLSAVAAAALTTVGMPMELLVTAHAPGTPVWGTLLATATGLCALVVLLAFRHRPSRRLVGIAYAACAASVVLAFYISDQHLAAHAKGWMSFQGHKLGTLVGALLAPSFALGLATIAAHGGAALLELALFSDAARAAVALGEPWITCCFVIAALFALTFRFSRIDLERQLAHAEAASAAARQIARTLLHVKDLTNTPLQTLAVAMSLLDDAEQRPRALGAATRALASLSALNAELSRYEEHLDWRDEDLAFDARERLRGRLQSAAQAPEKA